MTETVELKRLEEMLDDLRRWTDDMRAALTAALSTQTNEGGE